MNRCIRVHDKRQIMAIIWLTHGRRELIKERRSQTTAFGIEPLAFFSHFSRRRFTDDGRSEAMSGNRTPTPCRRCKVSPFGPGRRLAFLSVLNVGGQDSVLSFLPQFTFSSDSNGVLMHERPNCFEIENQYC